MTDNFDDIQKEEVKRKHHRTEIFVDVIYEVASPIKGVGLSRNISHGGLCLLLDNEIPLGTILKLKYRLPHEEHRLVETTVEVIWQKKTDKGYITGVKHDR
jgi:c-di-GMP-binding flagellar brake protein YcgR